MTPKLTDEMRDVLDRRPGQPIEVEDDHSDKVDVLVERDEFTRLVDDALRRALQLGLDQADRGESTPCSAEAFLAEAHRKHARRSS